MIRSAEVRRCGGRVCNVWLQLIGLRPHTGISALRFAEGREIEWSYAEVCGGVRSKKIYCSKSITS